MNAQVSKQEVLDAMKNAGFDGRPFCTDLEAVCQSRKRRGKANRKNRYDSYVKWAITMYRKNIGINEIDSPKYAFPEPVLNYIRDIVPGDIKGEIRDDAYPVTLTQFCTALEIPPFIE